MIRNSEEILREAYAAFNSRDIEAGVALMHRNIEWPNIAEGGFVHGHEEVRWHWREQFDQVDPRIEVIEVTTRSDVRVADLVRQIVRKLDGTELSDDRLVHVFTVDNGLITRMDVEPASQ